MHSEIKINVPDEIDENTDFTEIFGGAISYFIEGVKKNNESVMIEHAKVFPYVIDFFKEKTRKGTSPVKILEKSLQGTGPFIPGCSLVSIPIPELFRINDLMVNNEKLKQLFFNQEWMKPIADEAYKKEISDELEMQCVSSLINKKNNEPIKSFSRYDFNRTFAQVLTGGLEASIQMGHEEVLVIPSFVNRAPNLLTEMKLNYIGEGLQRGTLVIEDKAGNYLGKHSDGGTIIAKQGAGKYAGDVARNVNFYIGGDIESITQVHNCNFCIKGSVHGRINGNNSHFNICYLLSPGLDKETDSLYQHFVEAQEARKKIKEKILKDLQDNQCTFKEMDIDAANRYDKFVSSLKK